MGTDSCRLRGWRLGASAASCNISLGGDVGWLFCQPRPVDSLLGYKNSRLAMVAQFPARLLLTTIVLEPKNYKIRLNVFRLVRLDLEQL